VTKVYEGEAALLIDKQIARVGVAVEEARVEQLHQEHLIMLYMTTIIGRLMCC